MVQQSQAIISNSINIILLLPNNPIWSTFCHINHLVKFIKFVSLMPFLRDLKITTNVDTYSYLSILIY